MDQDENDSLFLLEAPPPTPPLVLSLRRGPAGERQFFLNGVELRKMLPQWSINGIGQDPVHFTCTLEVQLDLPDDDQGS